MPRLRVPFSRKLAFFVRLPRAAFYFVVVCLFIVAVNWAVKEATWLPVSQDDAQTLPLQTSQAERPAVETVMETVGTGSPHKTDTTHGWEFFHAGWRETPDLNLLGSPNLHPDSWTVSESSLRHFVRDPRRRLEADFQVAPEMQERVLFWMRIHTQYNSYTRVLHDRNNPSIIYGVADFTPLFRKSDSKNNALLRMYHYERQILKELKARLSEAAGLATTADLTPWERNELRMLLSRAGALGANEAFNKIHSIRSQTGQRDEFIQALSRSEELLPYIEATFKSFNLPVALARIPFVESSFNPRAYSKVGATGMWQFMPFTARQMISRYNPELWSDPLLQTRAAARMLLINRAILPDWGTAVTAYNSGAGRLSRLVRKYRTNALPRILEANDPTGLGFAGKNFYAQFLSANLSEAYKREIFPLRKREEDYSHLAFEKPRAFSRRFRSVH